MSLLTNLKLIQMVGLIKRHINNWLVSKLGLEQSTPSRVCLFYYYQHLIGKLDNKVSKWLRVDLNGL